MTTPAETPAERTEAAPQTLLAWRVHLLRRSPERLPALLLAFALGGGCVWVLFSSWIMVVIAIALLAGAVAEYLFPISYRVTDAGVEARTLTGRFAMKWGEVKRVLPQPQGVLLSPLAFASRLDAFRGVLLRHAPDGEPGDRASVTALLAQHAGNRETGKPGN